MLREEVEQYTKLTGEDGWHVPIMKVGAYLDGYNKGLEALDKIRAEIEEEILIHSGTGEEVIQSYVDGLKRGLDIIDKYRTESEEKE